MLKLSSSGSSGCGAKIRAQDLLKILNKQNPEDISMLSPDGERLSISKTLYSSIDTISPVTRNARVFGSIAVSHAFNDLHAIGVRPTDACVSFGLDQTLISSGEATSIINGVNQILSETKVRLCNAHTYVSNETFITITLMGIRRIPPKVMEAQKKYALILTKELGAATICHLAWISNRKNMIPPSEDVMSHHHQSLLKVFTRYCLFGTTDISGFGLIGHLVILARSEKSELEIDISQVPFVDGMDDFSTELIQNCSAQRNQIDFEDLCSWKSNIKNWRKRQLYSAETAGPILCIVPQDGVTCFKNLLYKNGFPNAKHIGWIKKTGKSNVILQ